MENTRAKFVKVVWNGVVCRQSLSELKQTSKSQTKAGLVATKKLVGFRNKVIKKTNELYHKLANIRLEDEEYQATLEKLMNLEAETKAAFKI
jgi:hypothetical protein